MTTPEQRAGTTASRLAAMRRRLERRRLDLSTVTISDSAKQARADRDYCWACAVLAHVEALEPVVLNLTDADAACRELSGHARSTFGFTAETTLAALEDLVARTCGEAG